MDLGLSGVCVSMQGKGFVFYPQMSPTDTDAYQPKGF